MVTRTRLTVVSLLVSSLAFSGLGLSGCKKRSTEKDWSPSAASKSGGQKADDAKPIEKTPPGVKMEWKEQPNGASPKVSITGLKATGELLCSDLECALSLHDLPAGTKVKLGDKEDKEAGGMVHAKYDISSAVGAAAPKDAFTYDHSIDLGAKAEITFPDGVKIESPVPKVGVKYSLERVLQEKLKNATPVLLGKEPDAAPARHTLLNLAGTASYGDGQIMGPAKTVSEIDLVAISEAAPKRDAKKKCSGYTKAGEQGPGIEVDLFLVDYEVQVFERKTGKLVDHKKFDASTSCPFSATGNEATSYPDEEGIKAWLRTFVR